MRNYWVCRQKKLLLYFLLFIGVCNAEENYKLRRLYLEKNFLEISIIISSEAYSCEDIIKNLTLFEYFLDKGEIDLAEKLSFSLTLYHPLRQLVNYRLGEYFYQQGEFEQAKQYLTQCVNFDSQFHEARKLLADCLLKLNEYKQAYKHYNVLSWFKPDYDIIKNVEYLSNHIGNNNQIKNNDVKFTTVEISSVVANSPYIDVGISTKDNGKLIKIDCVEFYVNSNFEVYNKNGKKLFQFSCDDGKVWKIVFRTKIKHFGIISPKLGKEYRVDGPLIVIKPIDESATIFVAEYKWFKKNFRHNREYRGMLCIRNVNDQIIVINRIKLDEYLYSVVRKEIGCNKPQEALKVQAVVARTVALYRKKEKIHKYFDVCNGQHCQVYDGVNSESQQTIDAVNSTVGEVVLFNGRLLHTFFHANCGGITQPFWNCKFSQDESMVVSEIVGSSLPVIQNFHSWYILPPKLHCSPSEYVHHGVSRWFRVVKRKVLTEYLNKKYKLGEIKTIQITKRYPNGFVKELKIFGSKKCLVINKEHKIRNIVPNGPLRSASFFVEYNKNNDCFYFWGAGWGHGVGMCQSGVVNLASQDENYVNIIKHYYPASEVKKIY